jgi:hypothetical protein
MDEPRELPLLSIQKFPGAMCFAEDGILNIHSFQCILAIDMINNSLTGCYNGKALLLLQH